MEDSEFLKVAKEAAIEAGKIVKAVSVSDLTLSGKGHFANFATEADVASEKKVIEIITKAFPDHNIIAEESGTVDHGSEYSWAIDPIDGTIPFVDGLPFFGVSVGLLKNNKPYVGVINMVTDGELFWAQEGQGAFKNGEKISVRPEPALSKTTIALEFAHDGRMERIESEFKPLADKVRYIYVFGSSVRALSFLAEGKICGLFNSKGHPWDFAAGAILVKEAGGEFSDEFGGAPDFKQHKLNLLASNGLIHETLIKTLDFKPA